MSWPAEGGPLATVATGVIDWPDWRGGAGARRSDEESER